MSRILPLAIASVALLAPGKGAAQGYSLDAYAICAGSDSLYVIWTAYEPPGPDPYPAWVGYDVLRRAAGACEWASFVRVNDEIIPRQVGQTHTRHFGELAPATATLYEYWVQPVDANRQAVYPCCGFCAPCNAVSSCPALSAPVAVGTLEDWGWTLAVNSCPGTCYPAHYIGDGPIDELRPYAGTGTTFRFFGTVRCGTTEGCSVSIDRWEFASCVTPVAAPSWGRLKTLYR